jgi:predicted pyridoxine 5'-phosphate oxidase superfamily flavin-nucleotide-binding protein
LIGTVGRDGSCDDSPRGDASGVASILNPRTLIIPERRGNRRADSLRNVIETGRAALLFLIPGVGETLRVNGRACVIRDDEVLAPLAVEGKRPLVGIVVAVEECFPLIVATGQLPWPGPAAGAPGLRVLLVRRAGFLGLRLLVPVRTDGAGS